MKVRRIRKKTLRPRRDNRLNARASRRERCTGDFFPSYDRSPPLDPLSRRVSGSGRSLDGLGRDDYSFFSSYYWNSVRRSAIYLFLRVRLILFLRHVSANATGFLLQRLIHFILFITRGSNYGKDSGSNDSSLLIQRGVKLQGMNFTA